MNLRRFLVMGSAIFAAFLVSVWLNGPDLDLDPIAPANLASATTEQVRAGEYLVRVGNCVGCHTAQGGEPFAGGRAIETPFGAVYSSNLTPHDETGLGRWTDAEFYRAMRHGRSKDDRWLSPVFPYTSYTHLTRADSDAIFAWLRALPPVNKAQPEPTLRAPYDLQLATRVWRALYFKPASDAAIAAMDRGQYLVEGLGHCGACHTPRDSRGGPITASRYMGGEISGLGWDALPLAGLGDDSSDPEGLELAALLKTGVHSRGAVAGPMSEVVFNSLQYLRDDDIAAIVSYLRRLPKGETPAAPRVPRVSDDERAALRKRGAVVYGEHCASCHGDDGEGQPRQYPALAGSRLVTAASATNALRLTLEGGFPPSTEGNPYPYGMPPFSHSLSRPDIAAVLTYIRSEWGNDAPAVSVVEVERR